MDNQNKKFSDLDLDINQLFEMYISAWDSLAPMAYSFYLKSGRGALFFDLSIVKVDIKNSAMNTEIAYVPENNLKWLASVLDEKTKSLLKTYDAEKMIILLLKFGDNSVKTMYIGTDNNRISPKDLYEAQKKRPIH